MSTNQPTAPAAESRVEKVLKPNPLYGWDPALQVTSTLVPNGNPSGRAYEIKVNGQTVGYALSRQCGRTYEWDHVQVFGEWTNVYGLRSQHDAAVALVEHHLREGSARKA